MAHKRRLGYVPEEPHLLFAPKRPGVPRHGRQVRDLPAGTTAVRIDGLLRLLHGDRRVSLSTYAKGMRQKVLLAAALLHNPGLVLLDEPFSGLDVSTGLVLLRSLIKNSRRAGKWCCSARTNSRP